MVVAVFHCHGWLLAFLFLFCGHLVSGLYEDQVGKHDWRHQYVGAVKFIEFDQSSGSGRRVLVATNQNVVASLTSKNGAINWRQILEDGNRGQIDALLHYKNNLITFNPVGQYIRSWHTSTGHLVWETTFPAEVPHNGGRAAFLGNDKNKFVAQSGDSVAVFDASKGTVLWNKQLPNSATTNYNIFGASDDGIAVAGRTAGGLSLVKYSPSGVQESTSVLPAFWAKDNTQCHMVRVKFLICYDDSTDSLQWTAVKSGTEFRSTSLHSLNLVFKNPQLIPLTTSNGHYFGVRLLDNSLAVFKISSTGIQLVKQLANAYAIHATKFEDDDLFSVVSAKDSQNLEVQSYSFETGLAVADFKASVSLSHDHGAPAQLTTLLVRKKDGTATCRVVVAMEDQAVLMMGQSGRMSWIREESLSSILAVEMVDLPVSENQAKFEDEFGSNGRDVLGMFLKRFETQLSQLKTFLLHIKTRLINARHHQHHVMEDDTAMATDEDEEDDDEDYMTRDEFNLHKLIVVVTAAGKVFGMDSARGRVVWQTYLRNMVPFERMDRSSILLFVQRTTAHFPHSPQCAVVGKSKVTGHGILYTFNPITGQAVGDDQGLDLGHTISVASLLSITDQHFLKGILIMDNDKKVHLYPNTMLAQLVEERNSLFIYTIDPDTGKIAGYGLKYDQGIKSEQLWTVNIPSDVERIAGVVGRRSMEHVNSHGKVLADRSVLYKYINPNLVAIVSESLVTDDKAFISVYLLDTVSGHMMFQATHKRALGPVNMVHSENWIVYNYWNIKARRNEVAVLELYEGANQHNATAFSSLDPPPLPIVMRQSYIMPTGISTMASSITEKGLTNKNIILALKNGHLQEISKMWLDPRRPITHTAQHREEGVPPYIPELPYDTLAMTNYNQSVHNIRGIHTSPAGLESTSLVLAYGLDMFYTKVTPSKMFDVLKEDFDYFFISCVLSAMILVTVVAQKLAARKALKKAWK